MRFVELPPVLPNQDIFGAAKGAFTFIITHDRPDGFTASVKVKGATPYDGTRHDLGGYAAYKTFTDAETACNTFYRHRNG